jgi:hypothetical protein
MIRSLARNFNPNRGWTCNCQWQYSPTYFKLNIPLLHGYSDEAPKYIIETIQINKTDIEIYGRLIEEIKSQPNKNIDTQYTNGKTGW